MAPRLPPRRAEPSATVDRSVAGPHTASAVLHVTPGEQVLPELLACPVEAHLGRRLGDPELGGDGLVGQVVDVSQHHHLAELGGKCLEGVGEPGAQRRGVGLLLGVVGGPFVDHGVGVEELLVAVLAALAQLGGRAVRGDPVHPRGELRVAAEALQATEGSEVGLLHHVAARPPRCR